MAVNISSTENVAQSTSLDYTTIPTVIKTQIQRHNITLLLQSYNRNTINSSFNCSNNCSRFTQTRPEMQTLSCSDWQEAQHALFQLANLCLIISFLTPSSFRYHAFCLRVIISFGCLFFGLWAGVFVCMPDVVAWNIVFFIVNFSHLVYLGYKMFPARLGKLTCELYDKVFKPLNVERNRFKAVAQLGDTYLLTKGNFYATEGRTKCGNKLSMLLKGRLKVTYQNMYLHSIEVNQFIDSPEYDMFGTCDEDEDTYQVSIIASEDSFLLTWSAIKLKTYLDTDPFMSAVFNNVIGKDVSNKLYQIQELLLSDPDYMKEFSSRQSSMVNLRSALVTKNSSAALYKLNCFGVHLKGWNIHHHGCNKENVIHYPVETFESQV